MNKNIKQDEAGWHKVNIFNAKFRMEKKEIVFMDVKRDLLKLLLNHYSNKEFQKNIMHFLSMI